MIRSNHTFCAEYYDGTLRITLEGEIDHHSAVATRGEIDRLIYEYRPRRFELALSRIGFMDSSGLGLVMGRYTLVRELGRSTSFTGWSCISLNTLPGHLGKASERKQPWALENEFRVHSRKGV